MQLQKNRLKLSCLRWNENPTEDVKSKILFIQYLRCMGRVTHHVANWGRWVQGMAGDPHARGRNLHATATPPASAWLSAQACSWSHDQLWGSSHACISQDMFLLPGPAPRHWEMQWGKMGEQRADTEKENLCATARVHGPACYAVHPQPAAIVEQMWLWGSPCTWTSWGQQ